MQIIRPIFSSDNPNLLLHRGIAFIRMVFPHSSLLLREVVRSRVSTQLYCLRLDNVVTWGNCQILTDRNVNM